MSSLYQLGFLLVVCLLATGCPADPAGDSSETSDGGEAADIARDQPTVGDGDGDVVGDTSAWGDTSTLGDTSALGDVPTDDLPSPPDSSSDLVFDDHSGDVHDLTSDTSEANDSGDQDPVDVREDIVGLDLTAIPPSCGPVDGGGTEATAQPMLIGTLYDGAHEGWLSSPAVVDLDGDGEIEIIVGREGEVLGWHIDNSVVFRGAVEGRVWASPVVADFIPGGDLEVAAASRENIYLWDASGTLLEGFPVSWRGEFRSLAAGDIDGDDLLELVAVTTSRYEDPESSVRDIVYAVEANGDVVSGFPPNTTGTSGCDTGCYVTGGYDQTLAIGDVDGDERADILAPHDNAYMSLHHGDGTAFQAAEIFNGRTYFMGIRFLHDYALAQQGYADDEQVSSQAHFTNSAPAIADIVGDDAAELVVLGSVQNANQSDRLRGVALWVLNSDGTRPEDWLEPVHFPGYRGGLWDLGDNIVAATNQVAVVDLLGDRAGFEMVFADFDGQIHCVDATGDVAWSYRYTESDVALTGGVAVADLSGDGRAEVVFATYSTEADVSELVILDAGGGLQRSVALPGRGAMAVVTLADADGDDTLDIVVNLKDESSTQQVLVFEVPGSADNCLLWATGRGNLLRDGFVSSAD